jgi:hypothetical protein
MLATFYSQSLSHDRPAGPQNVPRDCIKFIGYYDIAGHLAASEVPLHFLGLLGLPISGNKTETAAFDVREPAKA